MRYREGLVNKSLLLFSGGMDYVFLLILVDTIKF